MPQISVIVPVYNVESYLHRCVDSILGQTFTDFELILVDDGSPDNCPAICDEYAQKDSRVVVIHQKNGGLSAARNAGIDWAFANSDSQWLTFIDSDDWVHPEYLERLLKAAVENDVAVSICGFERTSGEKPHISASDFQITCWTPEDFYISDPANTIIACGKLYLRDCFLSVRYPLNKLHEDEFTTYKIIFILDKIAAIPAPMYFYFQNPKGIMGSSWTPNRLDALEALNSQASFFQSHKYIRAYQLNANVRLTNINKQVRQIAESNLNEKEKQYYLNELQKHMRRLLRQNKDILPFHKHYYEYEFAYPHAMHTYWLFQVLLKKLHLK